MAGLPAAGADVALLHPASNAVVSSKMSRRHDDITLGWLRFGAMLAQFAASEVIYFTFIMAVIVRLYLGFSKCAARGNSIHRPRPVLSTVSLFPGTKKGSRIGAGRKAKGKDNDRR